MTNFCHFEKKYQQVGYKSMCRLELGLRPPFTVLIQYHIVVNLKDEVQQNTVVIDIFIFIFRNLFAIPNKIFKKNKQTNKKQNKTKQQQQQQTFILRIYPVFHIVFCFGHFNSSAHRMNGRQTGLYRLRYLPTVNLFPTKIIFFRKSLGISTMNLCTELKEVHSYFNNANKTQ